MKKFKTGQQLIDEGYRPSEILNAVFQGKLLAYHSNKLKPIKPDPITRHVLQIIERFDETIKILNKHKSTIHQDINDYSEQLERVKKGVDSGNFNTVKRDKIILFDVYSGKTKKKKEANPYRAIEEYEMNLDILGNQVNNSLTSISLIEELIFKLESVIKNEENRTWDDIESTINKYSDRIGIINVYGVPTEPRNYHSYDSILNELKGYSFNFSNGDNIEIYNNQQKDFADKSNSLNEIKNVVDSSSNATNEVCTPSKIHIIDIKKIIICYENDNEIKIKIPSKSPKDIRYDQLGFTRNNTDEWEALLKILKEGIYDVGKSKKGKVKIPTYYSNLALLKVINKKLINGINSIFKTTIPINSKFFENIRSNSGHYRPVFKTKGDLPDASYYQMAKDELMKCIYAFHKEYRRTDNEEILKELKQALEVALKKGYMTKQEVEEFFQEDKPKIVFDPYENRVKDDSN